jgi:hypothetical protein
VLIQPVSHPPENSDETALLPPGILDFLDDPASPNNLPVGTSAAEPLRAPGSQSDQSYYEPTAATGAMGTGLNPPPESPAGRTSFSRTWHNPSAGWSHLPHNRGKGWDDYRAKGDYQSMAYILNGLFEPAEREGEFSAEDMEPLGSKSREDLLKAIVEVRSIQKWLITYYKVLFTPGTTIEHLEFVLSYWDSTLATLNSVEKNFNPIGKRTLLPSLQWFRIMQDTIAKIFVGTGLTAPIL